MGCPLGLSLHEKPLSYGRAVARMASHSPTTWKLEQSAEPTPKCNVVFHTKPLC